MHVISVAPTEGAWMVQADILAAPLLFRSGGKAEEAAKRLGEALAKAGPGAVIRVYMAGGQLLGRFIYPPAWIRQTPAAALTCAAENPVRGRFVPPWAIAGGVSQTGRPAAGPAAAA